MKLEEQLKKLGEVGICLNAGITIDDALYSFGREEYEKEPFDVLLFVMGIEVERKPWGRRFSDRGWNLDMECVADGSAYLDIVRNLCGVAGAPGVLSDVEADVDLESSSGSLKYTVAGERVELEVAVEDDWAHPTTVARIMHDIEKAVPGGGFYAKDNGQASIWFYLTPEQAKELNALGADLVRGP